VKKFIKRWLFLIIGVLGWLGLLIFRREDAWHTLSIAGGFLLEMAQILPPVTLLSAVTAVWMPKETVIALLGHASGIKGKLLSLFIGTVAAGPVYAAFPLCTVLLAKGASVSNVTLILGAWAVIKLPMVLIEMKYLGFAFTGIRYAVALPLILLTSLLMEKLVPHPEVRLPEPEKPRDQKSSP
jgi:uncharacterized membrane protein YraQ (UPF0718 family)